MRTSRLTLRSRLTLVYGGLFFVAGVVLLAVTFALVAQRLPTEDKIVLSGSEALERPGESRFFVGQLHQLAMDTRDSALQALLTQGGIALLLVGAAAAAFGWLVGGRVLQPLHRVTDTARRIAQAADRGLHERIALDGPRDEVRELADTFDAMLAHLDRAFDSQRRFIANASHELRTPLTLNRALLEVAVHRSPASAELRHLGHTLLEINARHERLIDGLLLLARADSAPLEKSYVDLADIVEHVLAHTPAEPVAVTTDTAEAATAGTAVLLERLVQNLVDNAIRHNAGEAPWLRVSTGTDPAGRAVLTVANTGPVIARYDIPALFEPFRRHAGERTAATAGAGLGLSIVAAITRAHDGTVSAEPRPGGGLLVTVTLPPAQVEPPTQSAQSAQSGRSGQSSSRPWTTTAQITRTSNVIATSDHAG
ncbi:sensor histidine kinase [Actinokineospora diospyrosa]|uniref:histidine kinase n=1 Tax=Actinokineospora diospyrosa TaxID=103728 RepID=A0ABT1IFM7_9PSEU|nr:HAMP domain-containing sensor histidine kinase [Actinokineospora diospyrosa]MCP2271451.1 Signal transduction histidine kinase [Actinokineospora diospyrosa]